MYIPVLSSDVLVFRVVRVSLLTKRNNLLLSIDLEDCIPFLLATMGFTYRL
jgi:hypothetical protein